ncbi:SCO family protein [Streptomyces griseofuscus]|uniref:SCO family protein n=1 Tax=Streptomyces TaxID=1883 RepID=UPI00081EABF5|nr:MULTISPECIES: SCO family protein [unclassified Streptomyces]MYQ94642.1 SCO family protein [Streptomyces sp. SID4946]MYR88035.1 SCO family protein [Streptomyces sp. SID685]SCF71939.1 protein SCO1/2 [Streptomyces sp. LamerLS-31b]SCF90229.1 protein SCO1/2 [Streptomyces sp. DconLS]
MRKKTFAAAALLAAATLTLSACGGQKADSSTVSAVSQDSGSSGPATVLDQPWAKPGLVLTDTHGKKYDLRKETQGHPTLLYFGYTHCPDICPTTMSNIAVAAQKSLTPAQRADLRVVFVTTDPGRDTPAALGSWLKGIDPRFIGLTGDFKSVQAAARSVGISVEPTTKDKNGKLVSVHGTQVLAFSPKNNGGYVLISDSATVDDYIKDLPKIVQGAKP